MFALPNVYNADGSVIDIFKAENLNLTAYAALVGWFLNSLSQVEIATLLSLILSNSQTPNSLFGTTWTSAYLTGTLSLSYDPLNLLNNLTGTLFVPALDINVNFLSSVCAGAVSALAKGFLTSLPPNSNT